MKETKFKQTEVGMIPSDWEVKSVGQFTNVLTGFPFPGNTILENGNVRLLRGVNITEGQIRHSDDIDRFYSGNIEPLREYALREDDLVIGMDGSKVGKNSAIIHKNECGNLLVQRVARLRVKNSKQPISYLFYFISSNNFIAYIDSLKTNSAIPHISPADIRNYTIPIPSSIEEQQRIANALSDVDTLIANLEKLIAKKKNIKQGAMQQLLTGRKRLPGFGSDERQKECHSERSAKREVEESSGYKMTELGLIPSDWEFVPVSELAKDMADGPFGSNLKKEHYTSDPQTRIIQLSNIGENGWEDENTKYTTFEHAKTIARCIVPKEESILVAKMMPAGRAIICPKKEKQYVLGSDVIRITANEKLNSKYFVYASKSDAYLKQISDNTQGSTRQRTSISKLRKILILLPSLAEQTAIANVLSDMDTEIATLETKLAKYRKLKTGMMQQLLTGKIRLV
ncbi:restriction endonuclease subunit S [Fibrobacter sp.]|uniref:restriction endonuclease subunit S n=1 Tax=Fibrobacter sp. TaxID=35828 RepID=UPI00386D67F7